MYYHLLIYHINIVWDTRAQRRVYVAPKPGEVWTRADVEFFILFNVEKDFCHEINKYHTKEWAICLGEFELGCKVRMMPLCKHLFHSTCIVEVIRFARIVPKCPLCNRPLSFSQEPDAEEAEDAKEEEKKHLSIHEYEPVEQNLNQSLNHDLNRRNRRRRIVNQ